MAKDEKFAKMGFYIFQKFYTLNFRSMKTRTYDDFMNSNYYTSFTCFGQYIIDIQAINPEAFVEFLLKAEVPLKNWQLPFVYEQYIRELNKRESAESAFERNVLLMQRWSMDTGNEWYEFFKFVNPNLATQWIQSGRLSPWVLYTASTSSELFNRFSEEQLAMIEKSVEPRFWVRKFEEQPEDVKFIKDLLAEAGV